MTGPNHIAALCPHCGNTAPQRLLATHAYRAATYDGTTGNRDEDDWLSCDYYIRVCETCSDLLVYHSTEDQPATLMYPKGHSLHKSVPASIRASYEEAARVQNTAPNAYAVMLRRALEALCHDRGVAEHNLHRGLEELATRGEIPPILAEMTTVLRQLGNAGAHSGALSITVPLTWAMDEFFRTIVEYVYVAPSKLKDFNKRLERYNSGQRQ